MSLVWSRKNAGQDLRAGLVLGVESIPDGLAAGLAGQLLYDDVPDKDVRALVDLAIHALLTPAATQVPAGRPPR